MFVCLKEQRDLHILHSPTLCNCYLQWPLIASNFNTGVTNLPLSGNCLMCLSFRNVGKGKASGNHK